MGGDNEPDELEAHFEELLEGLAAYCSSFVARLLDLAGNAELDEFEADFDEPLEGLAAYCLSFVVWLLDLAGNSEQKNVGFEPGAGPEMPKPNMKSSIIITSPLKLHKQLMHGCGEGLGIHLNILWIPLCPGL